MRSLQWKQYSKNIFVCENGDVKSHDRLLKGEITNTGYKRLHVSINGESFKLSVHRLVAELFIPNPNNLPCVNHKDGNKLNNHVDNLEWYYEAVDLLAHLIWSEVGDEGEAAMWKAGSVVINRIKHHEYPNDLYSVVYQKGQYEVTWNGGLYKEEPPDIAYEVAAELLNSGSILPEDVLYQAEFIQGSGVYEKVGNTYYCYK